MQKYIYRFFLILFTTLTPYLLIAQITGGDSLKVQKSDSILQETKLAAPEGNPFIIFDSLHYRFTGDGNFASGNVNRSLVVLRADITYTGPVVSLSTTPRFTYGRQNGVQAERDSYIDLFVDIYKQKKVYGFGLATLETSNLRGITLRQLAGLGIGLRLVQRKEHTLSITNAVIFESTDFRERDRIATLRNSTRLKGKHSFLQNRVRFNHLTFLQPSLNDFSNVRWNTIISLDLPLNKWFSLRAGFENTYESIVAEGRQKNDSRVTFGFSVGNR
jgi:putative salt-induced outer membrane protein YdiY